ncbi:MAG TPA: caspase family protein, partial [Pirellulales bacterium]
MALVVGNSNYGNVPKLPNPQRDAISVGQMLRDAGFDSVDVIVNASNLEFKRAIRKFELAVNQADIAVIYYAGHGLEIGGKNFLIPTDAKLASDLDADDEAITLDRLVASADGASKLRIIILDACRDNPFPSLMRKERRNGQSTVTSGLGKTEPTSTDTLIAYAAKAGSTAEDGDGEHSPFTLALLKSLTVPGLDIRLAFGRVRDEVMRLTGSRQEPFVYGSLGGGNIALVPAPKTQETSDADVKGDYELVAKVGTLRAWDVFLNTHKTGFYADLARAQVASLSEPQSGTIVRSGAPSGGTGSHGSPNNGANTGSGNTAVAMLPPPPTGGRDSSNEEALEWNRIKDSSDPAAFERFIQKYPRAPLSDMAQKRLDILKQAQREREAAQKAAEDARSQAAQKKAAEAAARQKEEQERLAREAEAAQKAKAAEAERKATEARQKAEQAERDRAAAEAAAARAAADKQARDAEEARKKADLAAREAACKTDQGKLDELLAKGSAGLGMDNLRSFAATATCERLGARIAAALDRFRAEDAKRAREAADREKAAAADKTKAEAAAIAAQKKQEEDARRVQAEEAERQAKAADDQRRADQAAAARAAADAAAARAVAEKQAKDEERRAKTAETEQRAKAIEAERLAAEEKHKADLAAKETACQAEQAKLAQIVAKGSEGTGMADLIIFARTVTCDRIGPQILGAIDKFKADAAARAATTPNSPQLVLAAQTQLVRLGCKLPAKPDGAMNDATKSALARFLTLKGTPPTDLTVTAALVTDLNKQTTRVCPLECRSNEVVRGDQCVSVEKPAAPAVTSRRKDD